MAISSHNVDDTSRSIPDEENLFLISSREVDTWFLMNNPMPVLCIVAAYLIFVVKIGPKYMKDRKELNIKPIITAYNLYQTIFNLFLVSKMFTTTGAVQYLYKHCCHPIDPAVNPLFKHLNETAWYFFISKVMDLLDTVFFVLRKKQTHVTFLHVYHHANMVLFSWVYLKYIKGEQGTVIGWINAVVHTIMYSYYFLSTLGPQVQKYLWWKKYITKIQMLQFVIIIVYMSLLLIAECRFHKLLSILLFFQGVTFLILFTNFYIRSYVIKNKKMAQKTTQPLAEKKK